MNECKTATDACGNIFQFHMSKQQLCY